MSRDQGQSFTSAIAVGGPRDGTRGSPGQQSRRPNATGQAHRAHRLLRVADQEASARPSPSSPQRSSGSDPPRLGPIFVGGDWLAHHPEKIVRAETAEELELFGQDLDSSLEPALGPK